MTGAEHMRVTRGVLGRVFVACGAVALLCLVLLLGGCIQGGPSSVAPVTTCFHGVLYIQPPGAPRSGYYTVAIDRQGAPINCLTEIYDVREK